MTGTDLPHHEDPGETLSEIQKMFSNTPEEPMSMSLVSNLHE
jgi:hypothetical protein